MPLAVEISNSKVRSRCLRRVPADAVNKLYECHAPGKKQIKMRMVEEEQGRSSP
jgi:hypothetical protein